MGRGETNTLALRTLVSKLQLEKRTRKSISGWGAGKYLDYQEGQMWGIGTSIRFKKKINGPKISGVAEYLHCLKVSPLNIICQGLKSSFIMKRKEKKKGKHCLMTKWPKLTLLVIICIYIMYFLKLCTKRISPVISKIHN